MYFQYVIGLYVFSVCYRSVCMKCLLGCEIDLPVKDTC